MIKMSENDIDLSHLTLKKIAQSVKIKIELDEIQKEKEILVVRSEIEDIPSDKKIAELEGKINKLNTELKNMGSIDHPLLDFKKNTKIFKDRLAKLEGRRGSIDIEIYTQLRQEYKSEVDNLIAKMKGVYNQLTEIRTCSLENIKKSKIKREEITLRRELEGLEESTFQDQLIEIDQSFHNNEELLLAIDYLIEQNRE